MPVGSVGGTEFVVESDPASGNRVKIRLVVADDRPSSVAGFAALSPPSRT